MNPALRSCLYEGAVRHQRRAPAHAFRYPLFLAGLDLDELDAAFADSWIWSARRPAPVRFRRRDYLGDADVPLAESVRALVHQRTGRTPRGPIRLITHLRTFGFVFNPVSFYLCYDPAGEQLETLVAEITSTPWHERHAYVLPRPAGIPPGQPLRWRFGKTFHVSPFLDMDLEYDWQLREDGPRLVIEMVNWRGDERLFAATLDVVRCPLTARSRCRMLWRYPFMTWTVFRAIYWQALLLWCKRASFYPHPRKRPAAGAPET